MKGVRRQRHRGHDHYQHHHLGHMQRAYHERCPTAEAYSHGPCQVSTSAKPWLLNKVLPLRSGISQRRQRMTSIKAAWLPPRSIKLHGLEAKLAFAHALALDNDDNIDNDNVDNAVVLPHANKDSRDLQSSYLIHAGGSLSSCEVSSICCCVIIINAVWGGPLVPSMGRLSKMATDWLVAS